MFISKDGLLSSAPLEEHPPRHGPFPAVLRGLRDAANPLRAVPPLSRLRMGRGWAAPHRGVRNQGPGEHPTLRLIAHPFPYGNAPWERSQVTDRLAG